MSRWNGFAFLIDCDLSSSDLSVSYLLGALDLFQKGAKFPGLGIESTTHSLVVTGSIWWARQVGRTKLSRRKGKKWVICLIIVYYYLWNKTLMKHGQHEIHIKVSCISVHTEISYSKMRPFCEQSFITF